MTRIPLAHALALLTLVGGCTGDISEPPGLQARPAGPPDATAQPAAGPGEPDAGPRPGQPDADYPDAPGPSPGQPDAGEPDVTPHPDIPEPDPGPVAKPSFACEPDAASASVSPIRRLSSRQLTHALRDLIAWALDSPSEAAAVMAEVAPQLQAVPLDVGAERSSQSVGGLHVEAHFELAEAVALALTTPDRLEALAGSCATDGDPGNDEACVTDFVAEFGLRATRRPLTAAYTAFLLDEVYTPAEGLTQGLRDLVTALIASPFFTWQIELGGDSGPAPNTYALTAHELAARLSFHFWNTMPDEPLFAAAADGSLLEEAGFQAQVERLVSDPRAPLTAAGFVAQWLDLEHLAEGRDPYTALNNPGYLEFAGDDLPSEGLIDQMLDDVLAAADHVIFAEGGTLDAFVSDSRSFAREDELAGIYGVPTWDPSGAGAPPHFVEPERRGLLARALFLANADWANTVVRKGVFILETLMCEELGLPPEGAEGTPTPLEWPYTERARIESITSGPDCAGCHDVINPLGSATEAFDALGRLRADGTEYTWEGGESAWLPVDHHAEVLLPPSWTATPTSSAEALTQLLLDSGYVHHCFAQRYFEFTFARQPDPALDGCTLEALREALVAGTPLRDVLRDIALGPAFKLRRVEPPTP